MVWQQDDIMSGSDYLISIVFALVSESIFFNVYPCKGTVLLKKYISLCIDMGLLQKYTMDSISQQTCQ